MPKAMDSLSGTQFKMLSCGAEHSAAVTGREKTMYIVKNLTPKATFFGGEGPHSALMCTNSLQIFKTCEYRK